MMVLLVGLGGGGAVGAEAAKPVSPAAKPAKPEKAQRKEMRENLRREVLDQMRAERMWRMTEELKLDEATAAKVFPLLAKFDERAREVGKERTEIVTAMSAELSAVRPDDGRLKGLVDRLIANRTRRQALEQERITALRGVLTPVQQAKLVLLLPKLEDGIRHRIRDAINERRDALRELGAARTGE
jgi:hypothetical protein